jgi:hypothetical protein
MYRGLYLDRYSIFEGGKPPKTGTGLPFGTSTFSDEHQAYLIDAQKNGLDVDAIEFGGADAPQHFSFIVNLRCKATSFANTIEGKMARIIIDKVCQEVFASTPITPNTKPRCKADALLALSLEGDELQQVRLAHVIYFNMVNFPTFNLDCEDVTEH